MKIIIQRDRLVQSVNDVLKAVSTRTTIPILTGIKLKANEEGVSLTGSDSDISIESYIPSEEEGNEQSEAARADDGTGEEAGKKRKRKNPLRSPMHLPEGMLP